ncbi:beta-xylosidase [Streptomyces sp. NPDC006326]|uniref:beta-xylosidase n=1 Tax=Streptomyces sp. NPDC006326 TaxID=3156752 RepID=UPI0033B110B4
MALFAAAAGGGLGAPAAAEEETPPGQVEFPTQCLAPQGAGTAPADGTTTARITVDDPAPRVGDTVTVTYRMAATPAVNPAGATLPADVLTATGRVLLGGAQTGEVAVAGVERNAPVEAGAALPAVTMTGSFTVTAPGGITLAPGGYTLHAGHPQGLDTVCSATGAPVSARLTAAPLPTAAPRSVPSAAVTPAPPRAQTATAVVEPGTLSMTQAGEAVVLGAIPYGPGGAAPGRIGTVTVADTRGGPAGWSLTGRVTDFTGPGGVRIPGGALSWTPACTAAPGSPGRCVPGSPGVVGPEGAVLASTQDGAETGGTFTVDAQLSLRVPPYTPPGAYAATLTLTLS